MCASGSDSDVCVFLPFVCLLYQHQKVHKRMRKNSTYCVHTWLHWVQIQMFVCFFSFQLLCKSFTTKSSGEATQINFTKVQHSHLDLALFELVQRIAVVVLVIWGNKVAQEVAKITATAQTTDCVSLKKHTLQILS